MIDPEASKLNLMATKVEVVVRKAELCSWTTFESKATEPMEEESAATEK